MEVVEAMPKCATELCYVAAAIDGSAPQVFSACLTPGLQTTDIWPGVFSPQDGGVDGNMALEACNTPIPIGRNLPGSGRA